MGLSSIFKKNKDKPVKEGTPKESAEQPKAEVKEDRTTKTKVMRTPSKTGDVGKGYAYGKTSPLKKTSSAAKKTSSSSKKAVSVAKTSSSKKKATAGKKDQIPGTIPPELKDLNKLLKAFAERSRTEFNAKTANSVFTEYVAKIFRDLRYKMLLIQDADAGVMTMLGNTVDGEAVKEKIVVKCVYMRKGSVESEVVAEAQEVGAHYRGEEIWCVTSTDFTESAVRRSRKQGAKVRLIDGRKLYRDFISELEKD